MSPAIATLSTPESVNATAGPSKPNSPASIPASAPGQMKRKRKDPPKAKPGTIGTLSAVTAEAYDDDDADKKRTKTQRACDPCRRKKIR